MADDEQFSLCWNNFNSNLSAGFHESLQRGDLVDVTLAAEGQLVQAHRLVLSVCSPYFRKMFNQMPKNQHAFVFLKDVTHAALQDLIQFMYCGEVNVKQDALPAFISTAEALQIKGLTETGDSAPSQQSPVKEDVSAVPSTTASISTTVPAASQRTKVQRNRVQSSYKIESEESGDDKIHIQASTSHHVSAQQLQTQTNISSQKRTMPQRGITSHTIKRQKISISASSDGMDTSDTAPSQTQTVQTVQIVKQLPAQVIEPEYIELPMESINPKAEPDYTDETAEIETVDAETEQEHKLSEQGDADDDGNYVEDETYGDMAMGKYEESYLTEAEDGAKPGASGFVETYASDGGTGTEQSTQGHSSSSTRHHGQTHVLDIKRTTFVLPKNCSIRQISDGKRTYLTPSTAKSYRSPKLDLAPRSMVSIASVRSGAVNIEVTKQNATAIVKFIRSQKKCAQLVYEGYIYNRKTLHQNGRTTWRCTELLKYHCKASCVTKLNRLISTRCDHNHADHSAKIAEKTLYDYPEDLEEYMNIRTRDPIDIKNHKLDVIDTGAEFKVVLRGHDGDDHPAILMERETVKDALVSKRQ
ncbi:modifier of mdg4-like isoform X2 [Anopheles moucheti]|uniref:modifier of mdg4-like isoform X2 n=1 Tax=Anopheles moucheti TaxID=186751 RepID=UPI0022F10A48|nr:modifier of mdg4-like isoform X2 [Anopheles moucheti]